MPTTTLLQVATGTDIGTDMEPSSVAFALFNVLLVLLGLIAVIAPCVLWVVALVQVIARTDLKESKILWALLLIFIPVVGVPAYFFTEHRKRLGWLTVGCYIALIAIMVAWGVARMLFV